MDEISEAVCDCAQFIREILLSGAKGLTYIVLIITAPVWVIPYNLLKGRRRQGNGETM